MFFKEYLTWNSDLILLNSPEGMMSSRPDLQWNYWLGVLIKKKHEFAAAVTGLLTRSVHMLITPMS